jgi:hypothetical protein
MDGRIEELRQRLSTTTYRAIWNVPPDVIQTVTRGGKTIYLPVPLSDRPYQKRLT